jgi:phage terminase small subunit
VEKWIANVGPFQISKEGIDVQPILKIKTSYERLVLKQADALGIGPQARARLNLTTVTAFNFAEALQKAKPITNQTAKIIADENREQSDN